MNNPIIPTDTSVLKKRYSLRSTALAFATAIITLAIVLAAISIGKIKVAEQQGIHDNLSIVLDRTHQTLIYWKNKNISELARLANNPDFKRLAQKQLTIYENRQPLINSTLDELRGFLSEHKDFVGSEGFFIIAPDGTSVASKRIENIGTQNLIYAYKGYQFDRGLAGQSEFISPIPSDIEIENRQSIINSKKPPSAFFLTPITDSNGKVIGLLTKRISPEGGFSELQNMQSSIGSFDTYSINKQGFLISRSRYAEELHASGRLNINEQEILSIRATSMVSNGEPGEQRHDDFLYPLSWLATQITQAPSDSANSNKIITSDARGYVNYMGNKVFGAGLWSEELSMGIICEEQQKIALSKYFLLRNLIATTILLLVIFVIAITLSWLRSNKRLILELEQHRQNLEGIVLARTQALTISTQETERALELLKDRTFLVDQHAAVIYTDIHSNITHINSAMETMSGYTTDELIGQNCRVFKSGQHGKNFWEDAYTRLLSDGIWKCTLCNRKKDDNLFWVNCTITARKDSSNNITRYIAIQNDITDSEQTKNALQKSQARLALASKSADIGIWELNINTGELSWDAQMFALYEMNSTFFNGRLGDWLNRIYPDDVKMLARHFEAAMNEQKDFEVKCRIACSHGHIKHIKITAAVFNNASDGNHYLVGVNFDISRATHA